MIVYPVKGINEDNEDADGMIVDAVGRALEVSEIVAALNGMRQALEEGLDFLPSSIAQKAAKLLK